MSAPVSDPAKGMFYRQLGDDLQFGTLVPCAFCDQRYPHGSGPHIAIEKGDLRFMVGACPAPQRCWQLHAELVAEYRRAVADGGVEDVPAFLLAVQQRLLGLAETA